jgi:hypothetical protein
MDIIKSILHVFKKNDNAFKIMHPETESACITDWSQGIVNTLASTALGGLVNTLTSDSLLATMIKKVLTATGVKYSMGQNGYICFGSLFGGLIIQWVYAAAGNAPYRTASFPIAFPNGVFICVANICGYITDTTDSCIIWNDGQTTTSTVQFRLNGSNTVSSPKCIAIGH